MRLQDRHRKTKKALKLIFNVLGIIGRKLQKTEFKARNFIEFKLYKSDRDYYKKMRQMSKFKNKLSTRAALLISEGAKTTGSFNEAYEHGFESFFIDEAESVKAFCEWLEKNHQFASREFPFVESNFENLYKNYFLKGIESLR